MRDWLSRNLTTIVLFVAILILVLFLRYHKPPKQAETGRIFDDRCGVCHDFSGQPLEPEKMYVDLSMHDDEEIKERIESRGNSLADEEKRDLFDYIRAKYPAKK